MVYYISELPDGSPGTVYRMHPRGRFMERYDWDAGAWVDGTDGLSRALLNGDVDLTQVDEPEAEHAITHRQFQRSEGKS